MGGSAGGRRPGNRGRTGAGREARPSSRSDCPCSNERPVGSSGYAGASRWSTSDQSSARRWWSSRYRRRPRPVRDQGGAGPLFDSTRRWQGLLVLTPSATSRGISRGSSNRSAGGYPCGSVGFLCPVVRQPASFSPCPPVKRGVSRVLPPPPNHPKLDSGTGHREKSGTCSCLRSSGKGSEGSYSYAYLRRDLARGQREPLGCDLSAED